jgi:hypothetical protein
MSGPPVMTSVAHRDTFRCPRCALARGFEASYSVPVDEAAGISQQNRDDVARLAAADARLVRCPQCGRRPRLAYHLVLVAALALPAAAVGATSILVGRHAVGALGLLFAALVAGFGVRAPSSADRAIRFDRDERGARP